MTEPLWTPPASQHTRLHEFADWIHDRRGIDLATYQDLWEWSTDDVGQFWEVLWEFFKVTENPSGPALGETTMPGVSWFPEARLNYAARILSPDNDGSTPALIEIHEDDNDVGEWSWEVLRRQVSALAHTLRAHGVSRGDRVVGYLPNIPQAVVSFLATASIGAVWAACGQDYAAAAAGARFRQLEPTVLIAADGYRYGGRTHDRRAEVAALHQSLPSLQLTIGVSNVGLDVGGTEALDWAAATAGQHPLEVEDVPFSHPLWVVFSSGTTGEPKGLVHSHGGVVLEHLKALGLHFDIGRVDRLFWYTSPSWMMWNFQTSALLLGASIVCYDGSPTHPDAEFLWNILARTRTTVFGTSPGYLLACQKEGVTPSSHDLSDLKYIGVTGSPLPAEISVWAASHVSTTIPLFSITGGTDVVSAFIGGAPTVPVWPGMLSAPWLGVAIDAFDTEGRPIRDGMGELVITQPLPSMPVHLWNDTENQRYLDTYFDMYPGVWRHGDWVTITEKEGIVIHGRSDSTLNRNGIRLGSADIYSIVEDLPEVSEALVLGIEEPSGGYWMPLFVVPAPGKTIDDAAIDRIKNELRTRASARHVPDAVISAPGIPHTRTGKKIEVPLKRLFQGSPLQAVVAVESIDHPELIDWYVDQGRARSAEIRATIEVSD